MLIGDFGFQIILSVSLIANVVLCFLVIGKYVQVPMKSSEDVEMAKYSAALLIGIWGGVIGNAFVTSMFKIQEQAVAPWFWPAMFMVCAIGLLIFTILVLPNLRHGNSK